MKIKAIEYPLFAVCCVLLFGLMLLTVADVVGRYVLGAPIAGAFSTVRLVMALLIFTGLPLVTFHDEHLRAGLLDHFFKGHFERWQKVAVHVVCFGVLIGLAWRLFAQALYFERNREVLDTIDVPFAWITWLCAAFSLVSAALVTPIFLRDLKIALRGGVQ